MRYCASYDWAVQLQHPKLLQQLLLASTKPVTKKSNAGKRQLSVLWRIRKAAWASVILTPGTTAAIKPPKTAPPTPFPTTPLLLRTSVISTGTHSRKQGSVLEWAKSQITEPFYLRSECRRQAEGHWSWVKPWWRGAGEDWRFKASGREQEGFKDTLQRNTRQQKTFLSKIWKWKFVKSELQVKGMYQWQWKLAENPNGDESSQSSVDSG